MKSLLLSLLLVPALAVAADDANPKKPGKGGNKPKPDPEAVFKKLDTNADSSLSLDEFKASARAKANPDKAEQVYKKLDKDSDGKVSLDEFKAHPPKKGGPKPAEPAPPAPAPAAPKKEV